MISAFGSMLQPGAATATAGEDAGAAAASNGAHREGGAGAHETSSDMAAIGEEECKSRGGSGGEESAGGGGGGSRWPRQETLALLQIRSDMDAVFRDSSHKGPLWDEISRKMAEMGYHRSAKKCREKFENVYKYHKRTKGGRASKSDGKTYRFFEQLEALEAANNSSSSSFLSPVEAGAVPIAMAMPPPPRPAPPPPPATPVYTQPQVITTVLSTTTPPVITAPVIHKPPAPPVQNSNPMNFPSSTSGTPSSTSSTSSDEEVMKGMTRSKRKRKWKGFFEKLTRDVMEKQEELQRKFLEAIDKRENERRVREEAWKAQEIARLKREHEILVQERTAAAAKDAALVAFLQKLSDQRQTPLPTSLTIQSQPPPPPPTTPAPFSAPISQAPEANAPTPVTMPAKHQSNGSDPTSGGGSSSRWPKAEIDDLIKLRTSMDHKYQENTPKGALWEEISGEMKKLGYNRNAKRCKEKWENINKYFKKVKEHNKRRREDSKTCPYYSQLEALYREKKPKQHPPPAPPIMAQPEQQWPLPPPPPQEQDPVSDNMDQDDEEYDDDDEDLDGGYEIVANSSNASSMGGATAAMETS